MTICSCTCEILFKTLRSFILDVLKHFGDNILFQLVKLRCIETIFPSVISSDFKNCLKLCSRFLGVEIQDAQSVF